VSALGGIDADLPEALTSISVPSYLVDPTGVIRWINPAAERLVGDVRGRQVTSVIAPEEARRWRESFARKIVGGEPVTDAQVVVFDTEGERRQIEISSVPLRDGHRVVGVFGQVADPGERVEPTDLPLLTPRQSEVLRMLQHGRSTEQIAVELQLSPETVRNHVRRLLRTLGVHTRLEAVAVAHGADTSAPTAVWPASGAPESGVS
jgi:PAS domain S-box-containing protein